MSLEQKGKIVSISDTVQVSEKFKKREFVIAIVEEVNGNTYTNFGKFQLVQNKCEILDRFKEGDAVNVHFNIKGNKWERDGKVNYITNLDAWKVEGIQQVYTQVQQQSAPAAPPASANSNFNPSPETVDDLPF